MSHFNPKHLGKWQGIYNDLINGPKLPLNESSCWMMGEKHGLIAVFDQDEILYIEASNNIFKSIHSFITSGSSIHFRNLVAIIEFNISEKTAHSRSSKGPLSKKIDKRIGGFSYSVVQEPKNHINNLARAFNVVSDSRLSGPTAVSNISIDSLPK